MKQHITKEQLNELSEEGKERLESWCRDRGHMGWEEGPTPRRGDNVKYKLPLLSIGQMIEFLDEYDYGIDITDEFEGFCVWTKDNRYHTDKELVRALWEAIGEILNE